MTQGSTSNSKHFGAGLLEAGAPAYAAYATNRLFEIRPESRDRLQRGSFPDWKTHLALRVQELAVALEMDAPELFATAVRWSREAFTPRDIPVEDLSASLQSLETVLKEELPSPALNGIDSYFRAAEKAIAEEREPSPGLDPQNPAHRLALEFMEACLSGETGRGVQLIRDAHAQGRSATSLVSEVLVAAQVEVGRLWHLGKLDIHEERVVTATSQSVLTLLRDSVPGPGDGARTVVGASVQGNDHDMGIRVLLDLFHLEGWKAINLGSNMPRESLARSILDFEADLVVLSATLIVHLKHVRTAIDAIRELSPDVKILVGGPAFRPIPDAWESIGADGYALRGEEAVELAKSLLS